jgi:hypothetical protein
MLQEQQGLLKTIVENQNRWKKSRQFLRKMSLLWNIESVQQPNLLTVVALHVKTNHVSMWSLLYTLPVSIVGT